MKNWLKIIFSMIFLFGLVITIIINLIIFFNINLYWIILLILIVDFLMSIFIFFSYRRIEVKLSWIIFIIFIPLIGFLSYIFFGRKYNYNKKKDFYYNDLNKKEFFIYKEINNLSLDIINKKNSNFLNLFKFLNFESYKPVYCNNKVNIFFNGTLAFHSIITDMQSAKKYIFLNYFIISDGELFEIFFEVILKKIIEGVKIFLIYDHVGSYFKISDKNIFKLKKIGVFVKKYLPIIIPFLNGNANYRNHRKDIIIDGYIGYTGGMNLSDIYINKSSKFGYFNDVQIRIKGDSVRSMELIFIKDWNFSTRYKEKITDLLPNILSSKKNKENLLINKKQSFIQIFNDKPNVLRSINQEVYILLINNAKKRIWLSTPYFIPTNELILALKLAASIGVDVRLIISGLTDKIFVLDLTKFYCKELIETGIKIYEMNNVFNHSKIAIIDDEISIIGTCNLDYRSLFFDHQTTVIVYDKKIVKLFEKKILWDYNHSVLWKEWLIKYKPLKYKFILSFLKILSPIL